ncbi:hypothetical protein L596_021797 [Steinernema carpocapsae]|uniref:Uncharacterized protein n=1 Tax=Steinernema carpocapsae TaxID=34508 RepID=A0A4U5MJT2_STECR|nr:hypothetical protein L596_021797 [Steinernema carpocapsae]
MGRTTSSTQNAEYRLLIAAFIGFAFEIMFVAFGFWIADYESEDSCLPVMANFVWMTECGLFPVISFMLSKKLRKNVRSILFKKTTKEC